MLEMFIFQHTYAQFFYLINIPYHKQIIKSGGSFSEHYFLFIWCVENSKIVHSYAIGAGYNLYNSITYS